jgi:hypothetical protein
MGNEPLLVGDLILCEILQGARTDGDLFGPENPSYWFVWTGPFKVIQFTGHDAGGSVVKEPCRHLNWCSPRREASCSFLGLAA